MRDDVTMQRRLSLAGLVHKIIVFEFMIEILWNVVLF